MKSVYKVMEDFFEIDAQDLRVRHLPTHISSDEIQTAYYNHSASPKVVGVYSSEEDAVLRVLELPVSTRRVNSAWPYFLCHIAYVEQYDYSGELGEADEEFAGTCLFYCQDIPKI